jgi:hypothetical protein
LGWGKKFTTPARIAISQCGSVASILTLTVSCTAFIAVLQRLEEIEQRLKRIDRKIDLSFDADFPANLKSAQNAFTRKNYDNRRAFESRLFRG